MSEYLKLAALNRPVTKHNNGFLHITKSVVFLAASLNY